MVEAQFASVDDTKGTRAGREKPSYERVAWFFIRVSG
jgi:hypothetical protein